MRKISMSVGRKAIATGENFTIESIHAALFVLEGTLDLGGQIITAGQGVYVQNGNVVKADGGSTTSFVEFSLTAPAELGDVQNVETFDVPEGELVFRLDQISFPADAIAYRHVHAGTGYRHLVAGALEIQTDDHAFVINDKGSWFEPENSPVRATNIASSESCFVRAMILPMSYLGKPTIQYLNEEDADKPRLQSNLRFFDQVIDLSAI